MSSASETESRLARIQQAYGWQRYIDSPSSMWHLLRTASCERLMDIAILQFDTAIITELESKGYSESDPPSDDELRLEISAMITRSEPKGYSESDPPPENELSGTAAIEAAARALEDTYKLVNSIAWLEHTVSLSALQERKEEFNPETCLPTLRERLPSWLAEMVKADVEQLYGLCKSQVSSQWDMGPQVTCMLKERRQRDRETFNALAEYRLNAERRLKGSQLDTSNAESGESSLQSQAEDTKKASTFASPESNTDNVADSG